TIGRGAHTQVGTVKAHGSTHGADEFVKSREAHGWDAAAFVIPSDILDDWRLAGLRSAKERVAWEKRLSESDGTVRAEFERRMRGDLPEAFPNVVAEHEKKLAKENAKVATRNASEMALEIINDCLTETIGGSADLTGSNNTKTSQTASVTPDDFTGRYIHYGIREHAMAAAMNGIALHGGL